MIDITDAYNFLKKREALRVKEKEKVHTQTLRMLKDLLSTLSDDYEYSRVWLYGSWNKGCENRFSDIDLALEGNMDFFKIVRLQAELEKEFQRDADIRNLDELPFKEMILKEGTVMYDSENKTA